ncbi:MAG: phosphoenolpyruvate--protein phosphotransferase [Dehalococcoidia bacterium]|nr:phosphoenolpyruvate--protein phosphotransferase [Dehalococcoidia bacterium]
MRTIAGIPASPGTAIGPVFQYCQVDLKFERRPAEETSKEWSRLEQALSEAAGQLGTIRSRANRDIGQEEGAIFMAQAAMLQDPELLGLARKNLASTHLNAEAVWCDAAEHYAVLLEGLENEYMRARAADVRDVSRRVLKILLGIPETANRGPDLPSIICAEDLSPSDTVGLEKDLVLGFCTARGGETSHTAILARSLGLPAVVGAGEPVVGLAQGDRVILSGSEGKLLVDPSGETVQTYKLRQNAEREARLEALKESHLPAITLDGRRVEVVANIGDVSGARLALESGAEGVGLLRTEFLYLERSKMPSEEEQYQAYREILMVFGGRPVVLRTLDIGGDKDLPYLDQVREMNPFLGVRGVRLCLARTDLFKPQLRAALRAGVGCNLKIMFPMVAVADEVREARRILEECRAELEREGKPVAEQVEIGIMIEIPSAALLADHLASEVDFFSIGTNDLTQYTLAVDRTNAALSNLGSALSPAVLRLIREVVRAAHQQHKWVGLCGELAGELTAIPILLGLELDEFSMNPTAIPGAKKAIRSMSMEKCRAVAEATLAMEDAEEVKTYLASLKGS